MPTSRTLTLVGTHEIEEAHGIPRYRVFRFLKRGLWPEPLARLKCGDVWDAQAVANAVANLRASKRL